MSDLVSIVFLSRSDEERGFMLLMQQTPVHAYANGVYRVDRAVSQLLNEQGIAYREATQEEIASSVPRRAVRDPASARL